MAVNVASRGRAESGSLGVTRSDKTITVKCPQCQAAVSVQPSQIGSRLTCSDCLEDFVAQPASPATVKPSRTGTVPAAEPDDEALRRLLNPEFASAESARDTIKLEDDLARDDYPTKKRRVLEQDYEFSVHCPICNTRLDVHDGLIGKKLKCPDCHTPFPIRTPLPEKRRPKTPPSSQDHDDEFQLSAPHDSSSTASPFHSLARDLVSAAEADIARQEPKPRSAQSKPGPPRDPVLDSLQKARVALQEEEVKERPQLPRAPFRTGLLKFLLDPLSAARLIVLALLLFVELGAIQAAIVTTDGEGLSQFASVLFRMFAFAFGAVLATNLAVSMLGILQDTSNGLDAIESWPDVNFLEWIGDALYLFSGLFLSVFPAFAVAKILSLLGAPDAVFWGLAIVGSACAVALLFPFLLLSLLEAASPVMPFSRPVMRSLGLATGRWITFTILSILVVGAALGVGAVRILRHDFWMLNLLLAALLILLGAIYFRLLGRLTWCCDEAVSAADLKLAEESESRES